MLRPGPRAYGLATPLATSVCVPLKVRILNVKNLFSQGNLPYHNGDDSENVAQN